MWNQEKYNSNCFVVDINYYLPSFVAPLTTFVAFGGDDGLGISGNTKYFNHYIFYEYVWLCI